ncbi:N-acetylmuramoyl-L-alanine amidase [Maritalea porphyrae]|uniref:N-acetylmuramoyl-L-alanine amidase n=1 Tax=Maritalea porphyrae TaxID=880732 RepID=A0ABQ5UV14_9HYPH|nr:N-acetylmuramoyl-L-alanine amidase [Maritalea porphyrae]GLQ18565.1 N-acetylmuramoyl-L-alanine amidase [Maritalea porphyrae]
MRHWGLVRVFAALVLSLVTCGLVIAQQATVEARILDARIASAPERSRIVFDLSAEVGYSTFPIDQPDRLVVEFSVSDVADAAPTTIEGSGLLSKMSLGMIDDGLARAVIFLNEPVQVADIQIVAAEGEQPARLVIELAPGTRDVFDAAVEAIKTQNQLAEVQPDPETSTSQPSANQEPQVAGEVRPLILIDPGHGGIDMGAKGVTGEYEKDIVLQVAKRLQAELVALDRFDVALTRDGDSFLTLSERVQLARDNQANLFISLHADSFDQPLVRGGSVYTRDENATDVLDKVLAENENQADLVAGFSPPEVDNGVVDILVDLMRRETRRQSYVAAQQIVRQMSGRVTMRPHPLRQADFFVLQSPEVPSVLIELGFLSNEDDLRNLSQAEWQQKAALTLARGIAKYFDVSVQP